MALIGRWAAISGITSFRIVIVIVGSLLMLVVVPLIVMFGASASNVLAQILRVVRVMIVALRDQGSLDHIVGLAVASSSSSTGSSTTSAHAPLEAAALVTVSTPAASRSL